MRSVHLAGLLLLFGLVQAAIKCYAAKYSRQALNVCTSLSYCVSVKHKSGAYSYSCDGNAFSQLAVCSLFKSKSPANDYFYASQIGSSSTNPRSSRQMISDTTQNCYDGGELGTICCCSTDYCNSSSSFCVIILLLAYMLLIL